MRVNLEISHGKTVMNINASVGNGKASIKWLGMMAAHRFATVENSNFVGSSLKTFRPLPKCVYTDKMPFLFPDSTVMEAIGGGGGGDDGGKKVYVELYDNVSLDEHSIPIYHPWYIIAFHISEQNAEIRSKLIAKMKREVEQIDQQRSRELEDNRIASNLPKLKLMREIMKDQLAHQTSIEAAMRNEWNLITNSGILDIIVPKQEEQEIIRMFLLENYADMSHMYKYYSAVNSQGGTHTLEFIEFSKLVHESEILLGENANMILTFFGADPKRTNIHSEINLWEFFVSFIKIAIYKHITLPKKQSMTKKKKGRQATVSRASKITPSRAVQIMWDEHFVPLIARLPASAELKASLASEEGLLLLHDHLPCLKKYFCIYAEIDIQDDDNDNENENVTDSNTTTADSSNMVDEDSDSRGGSIQEGAMTLKQFSAFATFFLGISMNDNGVTMKDVRQIFSASQSDEESNEEETHFEEKDHQELLVFPEFIEAIARLGVLKYSSTGMGASDDTTSHAVQKLPLECIRRALGRILES